MARTEFPRREAVGNKRGRRASKDLPIPSGQTNGFIARKVNLPQSSRCRMYKSSYEAREPRR